MTPALVVWAMALASGSGLFGLVLRGRPVLGQRLSCAAMCAAAALGGAASARVLAGAGGFAIRLPWHEPLASFALRLDALGAVFLVPVLALPALGSVYGLAYWPQAKLGWKAVRLQLFFGVITGAMALVVVADNALLFLAAWEVMAVAGFALVRTEDQRPEALRAGWVYLAAAHVGTFALFALFCAVGGARGSFDFADWRGLPAAGGGGLYALALVAFGLKAGLVPLHFWLPGAHAAAPSHVSALMSGVLLKTGIYGLLRTTGFFDAPPASWGLVLLALGAVSGVLGVAIALAQHDVKRLLAYHSVENIGIIAMGAGVALVGRARGDAVLVTLGLGGALLHVVNHALFKSLLFFGAGSVQRATGTRDIERMGGLARPMPFTALFFLVGAAAISGLPPLNGFVSEWLVALGSLAGLALPRGDRLAYVALAAPILAFIGGLAAACFAKVHGTAFLGNPRTAEATGAHESPAAMLLPMALLAAACLAIGLGPSLALPAIARAAFDWAGLPAAHAAAADAAGAARRVGVVAAALLLAAGALAWIRARLVRSAAASETWGCGFAAPTARMEYTGSSFAQFLVDGFRFVLLAKVELAQPRGLFPRSARFATEVPDVVLDRAIVPAAHACEAAAGKVRGLFPGRVHFYAVLVVAALVALLAWRFVWW
ncbi:MAG TPA: proton-conducting transporter membrane subunit [Anaeromyxobacteraceae bacterium]|nr:proton-conducting transporter membrane subunit [Anaeromyxobacteraceae bacterium]